jgi:integration host factor subunit beta
VETVADKLDGVKKKDVESIIEAFLGCMTDALARGERVEIRGFGSFSVRTREARQGRNPKTGEPVRVPKKRVPFFTVGKELKERVDVSKKF